MDEIEEKPLKALTLHIDSDKEYLSPVDMLRGFTDLMLGVIANHPDGTQAAITSPRVVSWDEGDSYRHEFEIYYFIEDWA